MKINLSGHHVEITDSIKEDLEEKFHKISNHFPSLLSLDIIISKEKNTHKIELITHYEGSRVAVGGKDDVMYPAINSAIKKLDAALKQKKGQLKANLHSKPGATTPEIAYEKIQEMDLSKIS